jgi:hypothetical protein
VDPLERGELDGIEPASGAVYEEGSFSMKLRDRTLAYESTVAAFAALTPDLQEYAAAEVLSETWARQAESRYGRSMRAFWRCWLRRGRLADMMPNSPWRDHLECRKASDGCRWIVSHPHGISFEALQDLVRFCERNRLRCTIEAGSWYRPGATVAIVLETQEQSDRMAHGKAHRHLPGCIGGG